MKILGIVIFIIGVFISFLGLIERFSDKNKKTIEKAKDTYFMFERINYSSNNMEFIGFIVSSIGLILILEF